jgi:hypothetical protein
MKKAARSERPFWDWIEEWLEAAVEEEVFDEEAEGDEENDAEDDHGCLLSLSCSSATAERSCEPPQVPLAYLIGGWALSSRWRMRSWIMGRRASANSWCMPILSSRQIS